MAISFSKSLSTVNFLNAYNNNVVEFTSDNVLDSTKCEITIAGIISPFVITPINNVFYFNFKEILSVLINSNQFNDTTTPTLIVADVTSHIYNTTIDTYISQFVDYTITFSNDSTENINQTYKFIKSVEQLEQNKSGLLTTGNNLYALSPFQAETNDTFNINYFVGYPFDVSFLMATAGSTTILNTTNGLSYIFPLDYTVSRLYFSDGRETLTIEDYLPLVDGVNELVVTRDTDVINVNVNKVPIMEGEYIKWLNQNGGFSYHLFNCIHKRDNKANDLGDVNNDFQDVVDTVDPIKNLGKTSGDILTLHTTLSNVNDQRIINSLFDSPKVYYYKGLQGNQADVNSWLSCSLVTGTQPINNYKKNTINYKIQIELPPRYTMKL